MAGMQDLNHLDSVYPVGMLCSQSRTPSFSWAVFWLPRVLPVVPQFPCSYIALKCQSQGP